MQMCMLCIFFYMVKCRQIYLFKIKTKIIVIFLSLIKKRKEKYIYIRLTCQENGNKTRSIYTTTARWHFTIPTNLHHYYYSALKIYIIVT